MSATRPPRAAPRARNLATPIATRFVGDPAGEAITQGALAGITPSLAGHSGVAYRPSPSGLEAGWHGYARNPQPILEARVFTRRAGTDALFANGPNDVSNVPSSQGGSVFLDARYRALAARMMRSSS